MNEIEKVKRAINDLREHRSYILNETMVDLSTIDLAIQTLTEKLQREENKALTVEELREYTKPVWIESTQCFPDGGKWCLIENIEEHFFIMHTRGSVGGFAEDYGKTWLAYRNEVVSVAEESEG